MATGIRTPSSGPTRYCPPTATELLEQILAPDGSPRSASTLLRDQQDPVVRLGESVGRYLDALYVGAEDVNGKSAIQAVEASANRLLPGLSEEPAWPTLRGHLLLLAAGAGADPVAELLTAATQWDLTSGYDQAAVIDSRIRDVNTVAAGGRCRGCPAFPIASPLTPTGDHTWTPDHSWLLSSPTRSASTPPVKHRPGLPRRTLWCRPS